MLAEKERGRSDNLEIGVVVKVQLEIVHMRVTDSAWQHGWTFCDLLFENFQVFIYGHVVKILQIRKCGFNDQMFD